MQLTKKKAITVAAAMTLTAALTGGTLALWNDTAVLGFGSNAAAAIESGELSLDLLRDELSFGIARDHSEVRVEDGVLVPGNVISGVEIDISEFVFSPGDNVQIDLGIGETVDSNLVTLSGTNLVADLSFQFILSADSELEFGEDGSVNGFSFGLLVDGHEAVPGAAATVVADSILTLVIEFNAVDQDNMLQTFEALLDGGLELEATLQQVRDLG